MTIASRELDQVSLGSLKRYLSAAGWQRASLSSGLEVFAQEQGVEIVLPGAASARDIAQRIQGAVATLVDLYDRPQTEIISAIRAISYDLVRTIIPDSAIRHGSIKLGTAEDVVRRMSKILAAAAHGELHVSPFFERLDNQALRYAEDCRFAHTFPGSFGFSIESPVGPNTIASATEIPAAPPLERRAVLRLARGLRLIAAAVNSEDPSQIVNGYRAGLNANACEDLCALLNAPKVEKIEFQVQFSREWGAPADLGDAPKTTVYSTEKSFEIIRDAARALRTVYFEKTKTVVGKVRTLHSRENPSDLFSISRTQDVVVEWESDEFGLRNIRVPLGPEDYLQALEAHKVGRTVSITGQLEQGRQWRLNEPYDFTVI